MLTLSWLVLILQQSAPTQPRDLSALIAPIMQKSDLPAIGVAVVTSDGLIGAGTVGVRSYGSPDKVTTNDQWHIGSCTKTMTATLAARLVDRGLLVWDSKVGDLLGPLIPKMDASWKNVTLEQLLCHRSGCPRNFDDAIWERTVRSGMSPRDQRRVLVVNALSSLLKTKPNTETNYSNAGYIIVGVILEQITDSSWEALVQKEVFEPLGMKHTGFGAPGNPGKRDQPMGHLRTKTGWSPVEPGPNADNPVVTGPAGTVHTTLSDWSRFLAAHLQGARGNQSFLKTASWKRLHTAFKDGEYSPGWVVSQQPWAGGMLLSHMGSNNYWLAQASLAINKDFAVLIVTNVSDDAVETPFKEILAAVIADKSLQR